MVETPVAEETPVVETPVAEETPVVETPVAEVPAVVEEVPTPAADPVVETPVVEPIEETPVAEVPAVVETPAPVEEVPTPVEEEVEVQIEAVPRNEIGVSSSDLRLTDNVMVTVQGSSLKNGRFMHTIEGIIEVLLQDSNVRVTLNPGHVGSIVKLIESTHQHPRSRQPIDEEHKEHAIRQLKAANGVI